MPECGCRTCIEACHNVPGWFAPWEAQRAARWLLIPWRVFRQFLILDGWGQTNVLRPRQVKVDLNANHATGRWSQGVERGRPCVFLGADWRCLIHPVKPRECREALACRFMALTPAERRAAPNPREPIIEAWSEARGRWTDEQLYEEGRILAGAGKVHQGEPERQGDPGGR